MNDDTPVSATTELTADAIRWTLAPGPRRDFSTFTDADWRRATSELLIEAGWSRDFAKVAVERVVELTEQLADARRTIRRLARQVHDLERTPR
jgi:hypothetical protein